MTPRDAAGPSGGPAVSVIIPTYNRARLVVEAIESVRAQSFADLEIVVVDDGSTDDTVARLVELARTESRVRWIETTHTGRPGAARNRGVEASWGRLLAFLDSDDLWHPQKLELQLPLIVNGGYRICHTRERWLRAGREISQGRRRHRRDGDLFADSLVKCIIGPSTVLLERSLFEEVGGFREDVEIGEDYELWLRVTSREPVGYVDEPLTTKRAGHGDQLSEKYGHIEVFRIAALRDLFERGYFVGECETAGYRPGGSRTGMSGTADGDVATIRSCASRSALAAAELARKCRIYSAGARKRGRVEEAERYEEMARRADAG